MRCGRYVPIYANMKVEEFMLCHNACVYSPSCSSSIMQARVYTLSMSSPVRAGTVIQVHVMHYLENKSFPGGRGFLHYFQGGCLPGQKLPPSPR
jgi:hypothetical protein